MTLQTAKPYYKTMKTYLMEELKHENLLTGQIVLFMTQEAVSPPVYRFSPNCYKNLTSLHIDKVIAELIWKYEGKCIPERYLET